MKPVFSFSIIFLFLFINLQGYGQETIQLKGRIIADSLDGASIHIINLNKDSGAASSPTGNFEIPVSIFDTVSFSSIQFEKLEILITRQIMQEGYLLVELTERTNVLEEVYISNHNLTGNLKVDIYNISIFDQSQLGFAITKPLTIGERRLKSAKSGAVNHFFNYLSGNTTNLENIIKIENQKGVAQKGMEAFTKAGFINNLDIPENQILDFIYYSMENPNFHILLKPERGLELIEYYQMKAPKYLHHKEENLKEPVARP